MKYRLIFGVSIPLIIIIALSIIASLGEIEVKEEFPDLSIAKIFEENQIKSSIEIGSLLLSNKNNFAKRYEAQEMIPCLYDVDEKKGSMLAGTLSYSRGERESYSNPYTSQKYNYESVKVSPGEELSMRIFIDLAYQFTRNRTYEYLSEQYSDYEELILFEVEKPGIYSNSYQRKNCYNINDDILDESIRIKLVA